MAPHFEREVYVKILQESLGSTREDWHEEEIFLFVDHIIATQLSNACYQCFVPYVQGKGKVTYTAIAQQLGLSRSAVGQHVKKGYRTIYYEFGLWGLGYVGEGDAKFRREQVARVIEKAMYVEPEPPPFPREVFLACIDETRLPQYMHSLLGGYLFNGDLVLGLQGSLLRITGFGNQSLVYIREYLEDIGLGGIETVPLDVVDALLDQHR